MPEVIHRWFQVPQTSSLVPEMRELEAKQKERHLYLLALAKEVGAESVHGYSHGGVAGFKFTREKPPECPDDWRKPDRHRLRYPKSTTPGGKELQQRISKAPAAEKLVTGLSSVGIPGTALNTLNSGLRFYGCGVAYWDSPFLFVVTIPWMELDPEVVEKNRQLKAEGAKVEIQDFLLWVPPEDWVEIKEWQFDKLLAERDTEKAA